MMFQSIFAKRLVWGIAIVALLVAALATGTQGFEPQLIVDAWAEPDAWLWHLRAPRVILAFLAGAALAQSGAALQGCLHNDLADPYVLGVSGGAALGGVAATLAGFAGLWVRPLWAFASAAASMAFLAWAAQRKRGSTPQTWILLGVMLNALASAWITLAKAMVSPQQASHVLFWLLGRIDVYPWPALGALSATTWAASWALYRLAPALDGMLLGDDEAGALGFSVHRTRWLVMGLTAWLVASTVAFVGLIGFVGLVIPHICRKFLGATHAPLLQGSLLLGGIVMVLADALCRASFIALGSELPVGAITALLGSPFLLAVVWRRQAF